jgi:hypothetical protein
MDRRQTAPEESGFLKDLKEQEGKEEADFNDQVVYNGKTYRVPYKMVKEVVITSVNKEELRDIEHSARLQYRLLLLDSVLKAKIEFIRGRIIITYNPKESTNRKDKISLEELIAFLAKEGVHIDPAKAVGRDVDYFEEIYKYQFEPETIREHPPYGFTMEEWKKLKPEWEKNLAEGKVRKYEKFKEWQDNYLDTHPALEAQYNYVPKPKKLSVMEKIFGEKKNKGEKEKGFWFHGV